MATVKAVGDSPDQPIDLYVFCANTYNWAPDWSVSDFIRNEGRLEGKPVVAITVGSGDTRGTQKALKKLLLERKAALLDSRPLWLLKPNDELRGKESTVAVAVSMAYAWGEDIAKRVHAY